MEIQNPGTVWLIEAANSGHQFAEEEVAYAYLHGENGLEKNIEKAKHWLQLGVERGGENSIFNMANLLRDAARTPEDESNVNDWLLRSTRAGFPHSKVELAARLAEGRGAPSNTTLQQEYLRELEAEKFTTTDYVLGVGPDWGLDEILKERSVTIEEMPEFLFAVAMFVDAALHSGKVDLIFIPGRNHTSQPAIVGLTQKVIVTSAHLGYGPAQLALAYTYPTINDSLDNKNLGEYWKNRAASNETFKNGEKMSARTLEYLDFLVAEYNKTYPGVNFDFALNFLNTMELIE